MIIYTNYSLVYYTLFVGSSLWFSRLWIYLGCSESDIRQVAETVAFKVLDLSVNQINVSLIEYITLWFLSLLSIDSLRFLVRRIIFSVVWRSISMPRISRLLTPVFALRDLTVDQPCNQRAAASMCLCWRLVLYTFIGVWLGKRSASSALLSRWLGSAYIVDSIELSWSLHECQILSKACQAW